MLGPRGIGKLLLVAGLALAGCGGGGGGSVAVHVGQAALSRQAVDRLVRVLSGGRTVDPSSTSAGALRKQAVEQWISEQWLIGEAARRRIAITPAEVSEHLNQKQSVEFPGGAAEEREFLHATGRTMAQQERQAMSELASQKLRRQILADVPVVTPGEVADYYTRHKESYLIPEKRVAYFNNTKDMATALRLKHEVEAGKRSLVSPSQREVHELFASARVPPGNAYEKAIDSSKPHTVAGPYPIGNDFWLYEVVKITPPRQRTLGEVSDAIRRQLLRKREDAALARFANLWVAEWLAKTDCSPGYVVPRCEQYRGSRAGVKPLDSF